MRPSLRHRLSLLLVAALLASCAEAPLPKEGQVVLQAGGTAGGGSARIVPGPTLRRAAVLVPGYDPSWQVGWQEWNKKPQGFAGAYSGLMTGLVLVQSVPFLIGFWPAAVGVVAGTTAMGAFGASFEPRAFMQMAADDRATIVQAATELKADSMMRDATAAALSSRSGEPPLTLLWYPSAGPDTAGTDPLADARSRGIDGLLNTSVEAFGLAMGDEPETFGIFLRVRVQLAESAEGELRYERVIEYGPAQPIPGMPRVAAHTLDFLAVDQGRVFRYEMREAITRLARIIATDPALPLARR